jgi:hypothetical protein
MTKNDLGDWSDSTEVNEANVYCNRDDCWAEWYWTEWDQPGARMPKCPTGHGAGHVRWIGT